MYLVIKRIEYRHGLSDAEWVWLQRHLNEKLQVASLTFLRGESKPFYITIYSDGSQGLGEYITLFVVGNGLIYRLLSRASWWLINNG